MTEQSYDMWLQRLQTETVDITTLRADGRGFTETDRAYASQDDIEMLVETYFAPDSDATTYREAWNPDEMEGYLIADDNETGARIVLQYDITPRTVDGL